MAGFEETYRDNYEKLFRLAVKITGSRDAARDVIQDVFTEFYTRQKEGPFILYPSSWLYRVAVNKSIDLLRHSARFRSINPADGEHAEEPADGKEQRIAMVNAALATLKPVERAMAALYSEGLSYREIAGSTGIRFSSVGKTLARTLEKLENELKKQKYALH